MTTYEYALVGFSRYFPSPKELDELGAQGWELVQLLNETPNYSEASWTGIFKRVKQTTD